MRRLDPRIHRLEKGWIAGAIGERKQRRSSNGQRRAEATPFFERLSPAMTAERRTDFHRLLKRHPEVRANGSGAAGPMTSPESLDASS